MTWDPCRLRSRSEDDNVPGLDSPRYSQPILLWMGETLAGVGFVLLLARLTLNRTGMLGNLHTQIENHAKRGCQARRMHQREHRPRKCHLC